MCEDLLSALRKLLETPGALDAFFEAAATEDQADFNEQLRSFWVQQCDMPAEFSFEQGREWARKQQAANDADKEEYRKLVSAYERQTEEDCRARMLAAGFSDAELTQGQYVRCLPGWVDAGDPRSRDCRAAMERLRFEQKFLYRLLAGEITVSAGQSGA